MQSPHSRVPSDQFVDPTPASTDTQVLVIEDDRDGVEILAAALELIGITPLIALNGIQGLTLAAEAQPALILLDITLPDLSGFEVLEQLRLVPATQPIPVIALTAMTEVEARQQIRGSGFTDYLIKPFLLEDLHEKVRRYLRLSPTQDS